MGSGSGIESRTSQAAESGFLRVPRTCRDGPAGRLYGALPSPEILAKKTRIFGLVVRRTLHRLEPYPLSSVWMDQDLRIRNE